MARTTMKTVIEMQRAELVQLRALNAELIRDNAAACERVARLESQLDAHRAARMPAPRPSHALSELARAYCARHGVRSCTREQALTMAS